MQLLPKEHRIKREHYKGVIVTSMTKALNSREINKHLSLDDKNIISSIVNHYKTKGYIDSPQMNTLYAYYYNFVLFNFRYTSQ